MSADLKQRREALRNRRLYDMEPATDVMVEPGWQATPADWLVPAS